jgi:hypothetical protein
VAQPWTSIAAAFAIDTESLSQADTHFAVLRHRTSHAGSIFAVCNVPKLHDVGSDWNALEVTYRDQDGTGSLEDLDVSLMKLSKSGEQTVVIAFQSSKYGASSSVQTRSVRFEHQFDFLEFAYFIRVRLTRKFATAGEARVALHAVRLSTTA